LEAAAELQQRVHPPIASLVQYALEVGAGPDRYREGAATRGEPALDLRKRRVPLLEAEYAVEEEHLRVRADRERGGITEIEHRKVERVQHIRRRSREEIEHCRQLDPLKVVHAPSLLVAAVRAMSERWTEPGSAQTGSDGTCMAARHGFQPKPELRSAGLTTSDGRRKRRPRTCRLR